MSKMYRIAGIILAGFFMLFISVLIPVKADETLPQVRALWVDAFRDGIKTANDIPSAVI